jgi:glycosyltransferase involved in cell wall biosynthesis
MKKINILFVNPMWKPYVGGIEKTIENLIENFQKRDKVRKVGILTSFNNHPVGVFKNLPAKENINNLEIYRLNFFPRGKYINLGLINGGYFAFGIKKVLDDFNPNVIHFMSNSWYIPNLIIYLYYKNKAKFCYSVIYHDINTSFPYKFLYIPKILINRFLTNHVDVVSVITEIEKEKVCKMYHTPLHKFKIIPLGVNLPKLYQQKNEQEVIIICIGRLGYGKGQLHLIEIYNQLLKRIKIKTKLILVGPDGGDRKKIEDYIKKNNLSNYVEVLGYVSEKQLHLLYRKADIFVLLTQYEAFGLVFLEALSYKIPILTYDTGAIPEVLKEGAILVKPDDDSSLLYSFKRLVENKQLRIDLGLKGYNYIKNIFSWKKTADDFLQLYEAILK